MAKSNKSHFPQSGRCDVIEGILMGNQQTNALNKKHQDDFKPSLMVRKLLSVAQQSSCPELKQQAAKAADLLKSLPENFPAAEKDRARILKEACSELAPATA